MKNIGIIGCGNMGGAIATALAKTGEWEPVVYDSNGKARSALAAEIGCPAASSLDDIMGRCGFLLLAVKPQVLPSLYPTLNDLGSSGKKWISIAAGVPLAVLTERLGTRQVIRFMPNIAAKVGMAVTAVAAAPEADEALLADAEAVASSFGSCFRLPESQFAAFIGISGSAIAYVFQFFHALAMGGVEEGIPYPTSLSIARDTCMSAAALQKHTGKNAVELATMVCSAGGTTIKGMQALAEGSFDATVSQAVQAAAKKSRELEDEARRNG